jgi:hypothetical protein
VDESAMLLDDAINGGETHAGAAAALFGGEERLEDAIASSRVHGDAVGKLTDALECLRLEQLAFEKADFDNVFGTENAT